MNKPSQIFRIQQERKMIRLHNEISKLKEELAKATEKADKYKCDFIQKRNEAKIADKALELACEDIIKNTNLCHVPHKICNKLSFKCPHDVCIKEQVTHYKEQARKS